MSRLFYSLCLALLSPLVCLYLLNRSRKNPDYRRRWSERFGWRRPNEKQKACIWVHCVSVGESIAAKGIIESLHHAYADTPILVTTTTPTGSEWVTTQLPFALHQYLPYDFSWAAKAMVRHYQPKALVLMETEIWPNLIHVLHHQNRPVILANGRMSAKSARGYARFGALIRPALTELDAILVQSKNDARRIKALGATAPQTVGSVKLDKAVNLAALEQAQALKQHHGLGPILLLASTHKGEEQALLPVIRSWRASHPECLIILAPRHPDRRQELLHLLVEFEPKLRSQQGDPKAEDGVYIADTLGELDLFYAMADLAILGGSFIPHGGHNPIEPLRMQCPLVSGPHVHNFAELFKDLQRQQALTVTPLDTLPAQLEQLWHNKALIQAQLKAANVWLDEQQGATQKQVDAIAAFCD